jgi:prepilin-type N-terminal cleavage/methylation domain-containing protein/prepilin-type processing-associated H-X9-DG protein
MKSGRIVKREQGLVRGFTLIELLVVVAIIALLISIMLPALNGAKRQGRAVQCASNLHHVGQAFGIYLAENTGTYPTSYLYPYAAAGDWDPNNQPNDHPYGYLHWSWFLYSGGAVAPKCFQCPEINKGGIARTNPGPNDADWESPPQADQQGGRGGVLADRQAPRMAFTANAVIVPRNKLVPGMVEGTRRNQYVQEHKISAPRGVILATEFNSNWRAIAEGGTLIKSHRPVCAFWNIGSGADEYKAPDAGGFCYGDPSDQQTYGLKPLSEIENQIAVIDGPGPEVNAVGRHHPGGDRLGGTTNFLYVDGRVARKTILQTMKQREWGSAYYGLTGENTEVLPGN